MEECKKKFIVKDRKKIRIITLKLINFYLIKREKSLLVISNRTKLTHS
jgi:hypothetical protein